MSEQFYSAEEAAQILGLQVRTVRNYVREGRLPGVRIGKQYRIARTDLDAFAGGGPAPFSAPVMEPRPGAMAGPSLEVSSVVQVDGVDCDAAERITRTLAAFTAGRSEADGRLQVEPLFDEVRARLKIVIVGGAEDALELIRLVQALI